MRSSATRFGGHGARGGQTFSTATAAGDRLTLRSTMPTPTPPVNEHSKPVRMLTVLTYRVTLLRSVEARLFKTMLGIVFIGVLVGEVLFAQDTCGSVKQPPQDICDICGTRTGKAAYSSDPNGTRSVTPFTYQCVRPHLCTFAGLIGGATCSGAKQALLKKRPLVTFALTRPVLI